MIIAIKTIEVTSKCMTQHTSVGIMQKTDVKTQGMKDNRLYKMMNNEMIRWTQKHDVDMFD